MEKFRIKPENPIIIIDETEFYRIDAIAKLKEEEVEKLAEEKFLRYIKNSGISMRFRINNVDKVIRQQVITELNYDERGWPESVSEEVKHTIVDDITHYINKHFEHYKDDCKEVVSNEWNLYKNRYNKKIKFWKSLFIITFIILLVECISHHI
ncbi:hypothetical protein ACR77X_13785 [Bacteroides salyersiae]|uniref:hypothetical protein n=1 Tax=Bacteroides salyersiae TaxID=291644 RepID=UPI003DA42A14